MAEGPSAATIIEECREAEAAYYSLLLDRRRRTVSESEALALHERLERARFEALTSAIAQA